MTAQANHPALDLTIRDAGNGFLIECTGCLDLSTAVDLERAVTALLEAGAASIVVDLSALDFIDSTGIAALIRCRSASKHAHLRVRAADDCAAMKVLRLTELDTVFDLRPALSAQQT